MEKIYFAKLKQNAIIPNKEHFNAGLDIFPCFEEDFIIINPNETKLIPTGIASSIPQNFYIQIQERGSTGAKGIKYSAGVIDSSYRGEWFLATTNVNTKPILITKIDIESLNPTIKQILLDGFIIHDYNKALFQGIIHSIHNEIIREEIPIDELNKIPSQRGTNKLGSTDK